MQIPDTALIALRWTFVVALFFVGPLLDRRGAQQLRRFTSESGRLRFGRSTVAASWCWAAGAVALGWPADLMHLPLDPGSVLLRPWVHGALGALVIVAVAMTLVQGLQCAGRPQQRQRFARAARSLRFMMPVTARERGWWVVLSVSAGVCEELFTRGFLLQFLAGRIPGGSGLSVLGACLLSSALFGLAHVYQGAAGVVRTAGGGLVLGLLAVVTGGLWLPILVHALADMQILWMYRPQLDDPEDARRLVDGCDPDPAMQA